MPGGGADLPPLPRGVESALSPARTAVEGAQAFARLRVGDGGQSFRIGTGGVRGLLARRVFRLLARSEGAHGEPDVAHRDSFSHRLPDPLDHRGLAHPEFLRPRMVPHDDREDAVPQRQRGSVPRDQRAGDLRPLFPQRNEEGDMRDPQRLEERVEDRRQGRRVFPFHGRARRIRRIFPPRSAPARRMRRRQGFPRRSRGLRAAARR